MENLDQELTDALQSDARDFLVTIFRDRMGLVQQKVETIQAVMPEILVNPALCERFRQQFVQPTSTLFEQYIRARVELGHIRPINVPLAVRTVQSMFVGLLILRIILGDELLQSEWDELPEVLATILFDGLSPRDGG